ncbi:MAG: 16S rRNA (guanine(527)-N(7))-methyltransferase RsmG [Lachnospiraceae bacterium]|nr:16S rRNA (guanine(527)-N(7))-methyltransferase RsmG [Lachnospiraceae bacterium]
MNTYDTTKFEADLEKLGITLTKEQIDQFLKYYELLIEWNGFMNLTAITEYDEVMQKHFVDSLSLCKVFQKNDSKNNITKFDLSKKISVIDVGTGAGFPGIPLKIAFPNLQITLLDSLNKRVKFLNEVISALGLEGIQAVHGRAEDFARQKDYREHFDLCVSRAVANLSTLTEYCIPFVKEKSLFICYKSEKLEEEKAKASKALRILGGTIVDEISFNLPDSDIFRNLLVISKQKKTPERFPRKAGLPAKEPIS